MDHFHVYRDGQYDRRENLKIKINDQIEVLNDKIAQALNTIDDFFVNH